MNLSHEFVTTSNPSPETPDPINTTITFFIYIAVFIFNTFLGLYVNSYVLWLICKGKGNGISAEFFSLNLALCEILFCIGSIYFVLGFWFPSLLHDACFVMGLPLYGRPLFQCLICIERYLAVLHPILFLKYKPLRYRLACSALAWLTILGDSGLSVYILRRGLYILVCALLSLTLLFITIQLFCSVSILKALKYPAAGQIGSDREQANSKKRKAFHLVLIFTVSMCVQSIPLCVVVILFRFLSYADFDLYYCISIVVSMIMAYVSPVLYIYRFKKATNT